MTQLQNTFENIITDGIRVVEQTTNERRCTVSFFEGGILQFKRFAILQFLMGAPLVIDPTQEDSSVRTQSYRLYYRLSSSLLGLTPEQDYVNIFFTRDEVTMIKVWLETRMGHCEVERDTRSPKFNADTYIGQKLMLLELKQILMGEILS